ncbi:hypothetical protein AgCh_010215 [Apium graveolens]
MPQQRCAVGLLNETHIKEIDEEGSGIETNTFDFYDHSELIELTKQSTHLADAIGIVKHYQPLTNIVNQFGDPQKQVKIIITDGRFKITAIASTETGGIEIILRDQQVRALVGKRSVRLLKEAPQTEYVGGRVTLYYFESEGELTYDNLRARTKVIEDMIGLARTNNKKIDVYVKHYDETSLDTFEDHNLFQRIEGDGSNDVGEWSDELDDYNFDDSDYSVTDDDMVFANNIDEGVEWVGRIREDPGLGKEVGDESEGERHESDCDDLESLPDNDLEEEFDALKRRQSFPLFKDSDNIKWTVGTIFTDHYQYREAIMKHSYTKGRVVKFVKSDRTRVRTVCKDPCPWFIYAGLIFDKCIQIKTVGLDHTCVREQRGLPLINSGFLARKYLPEFRINPTWPIKSFHKTVLKDLQINFPAHILRKARRKCMKTINGTHEEQYEKLLDYKTELLKRNPNSTEMLVNLGKTKLKSAPFLSHGKNVISPGALRASIEVTRKNLRNDAKTK